MGYELERLDARDDPGSAARRRALDVRCATLEKRRHRAHERFECAVAECAALRGRVPVDHPLRVAAELRLAEARRRRHELALEIERLQDELDDGEIWS